ncbi:MAG: hypothetical protein BroJett021_21060 [Chloroflexota bacterium]|nr:MAG: hypothetical protein BroJett021_21060 [Chloroflexota bacterium]
MRSLHTFVDQLKDTRTFPARTVRHRESSFTRPFLLWVSLFAVALVAIAMRLWRLDSLPPGLHLDEAAIGIEAWRVVVDPTYRPIFFESNSGLLPLNVYANALMFALFHSFALEISPFTLRLTAAIFGLMGVAMVFGLAREMRHYVQDEDLLSPAFPLLAAASLAGMRWHVHFSRMGIEPILTPWLWAGALWALLRGWRTGSWAWLIACGLLAGLSMYAYRGAWVIPPMLAIGGLLLAVHSRMDDAEQRNRLSWREFIHSRAITKRFLLLAIASVVATIMVTPLGLYALENREDFMYRYNRVSIAGDDSVAPDSEIFARNIWKTAAMYNPFGRTGDKPLQRNIPGEPALNFWEAPLFLLGLIVSWKRRRNPAFSLVLLGLVGLALPGLVTGTVPHFHRIIGMAAPTAVLMGVGLDAIWRWRPVRQWSMAWLAILLLILATLTSARQYFVQWASFQELPEAYNAPSYETGRFLASLPANQETYLMPIHQIYPSVVFDSVLVGRPEPIQFDGVTTFPIVMQATTHPHVYVVIEREDNRSSQLLTQLFPELKLLHEVRDHEGNIFSRFFERPAGASPQINLKHRVELDAGDGIELFAYEVQTDALTRSEQLAITAAWRARTQPTHDLNVTVQLVKPSTDNQPEVVASSRYVPGEGRPYAADWRTDWLLLDEYRLDTPRDLAPGDYELRLLLERPTASDAAMRELSIELGSVTLSTE